MSETCVTCGQELPREATCPPAPAAVECEVCGKPAVFITHRRARCFACRAIKVSAEFLPGTIQPEGEVPTGASPREFGGTTVPNIIVDLSREMRRVKELFPRFSPERLEHAQRTLHFADVAMTTNSYESMQESLDDLRLIVDPQKK